MQISKIISVLLPRFYNGVVAVRNQSCRYTERLSEAALKTQAGFTLVELAIVIVIIGLLVGGILQGQELIQQAKIRSQIKQFEGYNAAIATFKGKYNFIPGDIPQDSAIKFGLYSVSCGSCTGTWYPNGNGLVNDSAGNLPPITAWPESRVFYWQLEDAKLISNQVTSTDVTTWDVGVVFPKAEIGVGGIAAVSLADGNLYHFMGPTKVNDATNNPFFNYISEVPSTTPEQAYILDTKLDDGIPNRGSVKAVTVTSSVTTNFSNDTTSTCIVSAGALYNLTLTQNSCRLVVKSM